MQLRRHQAEQRSIQKIFETYLPLLTTKVVEGRTICSYMTYLQKLAEQVNTKCVHVTNVGAAICGHILINFQTLLFNLVTFIL